MNWEHTPNTPEAVLAQLLPFLLHAHRIYEVVVPEATFDEFTSKGETELEGCHHSSAVRIRVKRGFKIKPQGLDYFMRPLSNNGIEVFYKRHRIKFYKGANGQPPACGKSEAKKAFYQQSLLGEDYERYLSRRLVVIYKVARDGTFIGLDLACPKGVLSDYEPPELYWSIPVPHPATVQSSEVKYEQKPDDLEIRREDDDVDDLDISLEGTDGE